MLKITICDINSGLIEELAKLKVTCDLRVGNILDMTADAIVSPTNSFGFMDGGIDYAYSQFFGWGVQKAVQIEISQLPFSELLVGQALLVPTGNSHIPNLIAAPTMRVPMRITDPSDVFLATRAAIGQALDLGIRSLLIPGMGTGAGRVPYELGARAMWSGICWCFDPKHYPQNLMEATDRHVKLIG